MILDTWHKSISSRGYSAWILAIILTGFYIVLYFKPQLLGLGDNTTANSGLIALFDPLSIFLKNKPASEWFVYGTLYTLAIFSFGIKFIRKYKNNPYQKIRTYSVMFFQLIFAYLLPEFMERLNQTSDHINLPYYDLKSMWPLNYYLFDSWSIKSLLGSGNLGLGMLIFGVVSIFIISPILTYKFGKRWYCSWVCGCGGLAETAGDAFRAISDKSKTAWKFERISIYTVLIFSVISTISVIYSFLQEDNYWLSARTFLWLSLAIITLTIILLFTLKKEQLQKDLKYLGIGYGIILISCICLELLKSHQGNTVFLIESWKVRKAYGFYIGSIFSGVIGTGFYPILGNRIWCRMGCPMAAILGFQQRLFSKFRITTNGGQCIACGNCSTYCEMGIDVRSYAMKGQNIVRASCVGCGVCSSVCPRGVLKLENDTYSNRINHQEVLLGNNINLLDYTQK